jgi:hypothetical protein
MKTILLSVVALGALSGAAFAEPAKMNLGQLDQVAGGIDATDVTMTDPSGVPTTAIPTEPEYNNDRGHNDYDCKCAPGIDLAAAETLSSAFQKDSGAAVHVGPGLGFATFGAASNVSADGFAWGLAF